MEGWTDGRHVLSWAQGGQGEVWNGAAVRGRLAAQLEMPKAETRPWDQLLSQLRRREQTQWPSRAVAQKRAARRQDRESHQGDRGNRARRHNDRVRERQTAGHARRNCNIGRAEESERVRTTWPIHSWIARSPNTFSSEGLEGSKVRLICAVGVGFLVVMLSNDDGIYY